MARAALTRLRTGRLDLVQLDLASLDAWIARDAQALHDLTGARFVEPVDAPPLFDEDLVRIRAMVANQGERAPWLFVLRATGEPVGAGGVGAFSQGTLILGYSIWPRHQRRGYATEAAIALVEHALSLPEVQRVKAMTPIGHVASERVLERAGLVRVGEDLDADVGRVSVYERRRLS
jgi:RimJ/RimL family protein N-acetyltransferase